MQVTELPQYNITEDGSPIGKGSYGIVYKVSIDDKECAIKQIDPELQTAVSEIEPALQIYLRKYALQECILLSKLNHPNIVHFMGVCVTDDNVKLVMEYLPMSLTSCLEEYNNFPLPCKFSVLRDACLGLEYLHTRCPPLIHRDISANNIMLTADLKAKLVDIGSARQVGATKPDKTMSPCPGALACMPPEALIEGGTYDETMDLFSMGNVILHVITQKWPIPLEEIEDRHAEDGQPYDDLELYEDLEVKRRLPYITDMGEKHCLVDTVVRCLQSDPRARPSATKIVRKLETLCVEYPVSSLLETTVSLQLQAARYPTSQSDMEPTHSLELLVSEKQTSVKTMPEQKEDAVIQEKDGKYNGSLFIYSTIYRIAGNFQQCKIL